MPKNYFLNREERSMNSNLVKCNQFAFVVEKHMQGCKNIEQLQLGLIKMRLSNGGHYRNGAKVKIAPLSYSTRNKIKKQLDNYYNNAILHFNDIDTTPYVKEFNSYLEKLHIDIRKECEEYEGELIVGRIQYYLYPEEYIPAAKITYLYLGLLNNKICDLFVLNEQLKYLKSNYYFDCKDYDKYIEKLIKYRTIKECYNSLDLPIIDLKPNYCKLSIENDKYIKEIEFNEI